MRYVPLGDSYSIGTAVEAGERWPDQLVERLAAAAAARGEAPPLELVANLAVNGFTTEDVVAVELPRLPSLGPEACSLQIGVNDVIRGVPESRYRANVSRILDALAELPGLELVFGVTTPDYTVTPAGADYGDATVAAAAIRAFNATFADVFAARGLVSADVHDLSLRAAADRGLVARDGLHPSGRQYGLWVDRIAATLRGPLLRSAEIRRGAGSSSPAASSRPTSPPGRSTRLRAGR